MKPDNLLAAKSVRKVPIPVVVSPVDGEKSSFIEFFAHGECTVCFFIAGRHTAFSSGYTHLRIQKGDGTKWLKTRKFFSHPRA